jgi:hypothetical protein
MLRGEAIRLISDRSTIMNTSTQTINPLRQRLLDEMRMRKLSPKTQSGYIRTVSRFHHWFGHALDTATAEDLRRYQLHLVDLAQRHHHRTEVLLR